VNSACAPIVAELAMISDFPIDELQLRLVRQLFGERTSDDELRLGPERRHCIWPLRVSDGHREEVQDLSYMIFLCAGFLTRRRAIVRQIHQSGCNLELCLRVDRITQYTSLASATMQQLSELDIQLSFFPPTSTEPASFG
jgi:hypothetical protein